MYTTKSIQKVSTTTTFNKDNDGNTLINASLIFFSLTAVTGCCVTTNNWSINEYTLGRQSEGFCRVTKGKVSGLGLL